MRTLLSAIPHYIQALCLINFYILVDPLHKHRSSDEADGSAQYSKTNAKHQSVSKIKASLKESRHLGFDQEVVDRVQENIQGSGSRGKERNPLPSIVLRVEKEVC